MDAHARNFNQERQLPGFLTALLPSPTDDLAKHHGPRTASSSPISSSSTISSSSSTSSSSSSALPSSSSTIVPPSSTFPPETIPTPSSTDAATSPDPSSIPTTALPSPTAVLTPQSIPLASTVPPVFTPSTALALSAPSFPETALPESTPPVLAFPSNVSPTIDPTASAKASSSQPFLQNKVLSAVVFSAAGVLGLVIFIIAATFVIRRRRNKKLIEDAVSFDPVKMGYPDTLEAGQLGNASRTSVVSGRGSNLSGPEVRPSPAFADYAPPPRPYRSLSTKTPSHGQQGPYNNVQKPHASSFSWTPPAPRKNDAYAVTNVEEVDRSIRRS